MQCGASVDVGSQTNPQEIVFGQSEFRVWTGGDTSLTGNAGLLQLRGAGICPHRVQLCWEKVDTCIMLTALDCIKR